MFSKKIIPLLIFFIPLFFLFSCENSEEKTDAKGKNPGTKITDKDAGAKSVIKFDKDVIDLGNLQEGEVVECVFHYQNAGQHPLRILSVDPDCGCTEAEFDENPLMPGEKGKIKTVFNSSGFFNNIYKTVEVETDAEPQYTNLKIIAFIHKKDY